MSAVVGYKLLAGDGSVAWSTGGVWGQQPSLPNPLTLPNGDIVAAPKIGATYGDWMLEEWVMEPPPPPTPPDPLTLTLTPRQVRRALIVSGVTTDPDGFVTTAIASMQDSTERALALTDWQYAPYYSRGHALFNDPDLLNAAGLTPAQVDQLWALALEQPQ